MAYDKQKAHEYYENYTKKGLKKGRKKSTKKTKGKKTAKAKTESLVGLSTSGLNDRGLMQAAMIKESIKGEMNTALAKAKTPEERAAIKQEYQNKAFDAISKLKSDPATAKAQTSKAKSGSSKSSSGSSKSSSGSNSKSSSKTASSTKKNTAARDEAIKAATDMANQQIDNMYNRIKSMSPEQREAAKIKLEDVINEIASIQAALKKTTTAINAAYK